MTSVGDRVAHYVITGTIGRGAMATVYRAHDERLNRDVALKVLDPGYSLDFIFRARFEREFRVTAQLRNDHVVPVYDAGTADDQLYIAMMLVDGPNVAEVMRAEGPLELARVVAIVNQVADALDTAHAQRVIHRDVKPANILLARHGVNGTEHAYLADFGLTLGMEGTHLTRTGGFMGTLAYSSPEQLNSAPIDGRADEYALAATAFQMLTGRPPFKRDNEMALINAHLFDTPPRVTDLRPALPPRVADVIARGMAKAPEQRYGTVGEFAKALWAASGTAIAVAGGSRGPVGLGRLAKSAAVLGLFIVGGLGGVAAVSMLANNALPGSTPSATSSPLGSGVAIGSDPAPTPSLPIATTGLPSASLPPGSTLPPGRTPRPTARPTSPPPGTSPPTSAPTPTPAATPTPPTATPTPPPADVPLVANGRWSVGNSPAGVSGDPYVVVGSHQRRYEITPTCPSDSDCRFSARTFTESGARLGTIVFRWNGSAFTYSGAARWYDRSGGETCETSSGELIENAYSTREQVRVEPRTRQDGSIVELIGSKTVSGTPTAAGDAAGCQPFEMTFDVEMNRGG